MEHNSHFPWFTVFFSFLGSLITTVSSSDVWGNFYLKAFVGGMLGVVGGLIIKFIIKSCFPKFYRFVNDKSNKVCDE